MFKNIKKGGTTLFKQSLNSMLCQALTYDKLDRTDLDTSYFHKINY